MYIYIAMTNMVYAKRMMMSLYSNNITVLYFRVIGLRIDFYFYLPIFT
jgi:hypothetical protein